MFLHGACDALLRHPPTPSHRAESEEPEGEEEEEEEATDGFRVLIAVRDGKKGRVLQVGGLVTDSLTIHRVTIYDAGKEPSPESVFSGVDESPVYAGPAFEELDDALKVGELVVELAR